MSRQYDISALQIIQSPTNYKVIREAEKFTPWKRLIAGILHMMNSMCMVSMLAPSHVNIHGYLSR